MLDVIAWVVLGIFGAIGFIICVVLWQLGKALAAWSAEKAPKALPDPDTRALRKHRTWATCELDRIYAEAEEQYE